MKKSLLFLCIVSCTLFARDSLESDIKRSTTIIEQFSKIPEKSIPKEVLQNASGLAIIIVIKGAFIFSGRGGAGLVVARARNQYGWSAPSAVGMGGAGFGLQLGAEATELVLVLNNQKAVDAFEHGGNVTLGGTLSVAAGPVGRNLQGDVAPTAAVYAYSRSEGGFAGIALQVATVAERKKANEDFYKRSVTPEELLSGRILPPSRAQRMYRALNQYN